MTDRQILASGGLGRKFEAMSPKEASLLLLKHYGVQGQLRRFDTEKDDTFCVETERGARYVLKVANPDEEAAEISLQCDLLTHLEANGARAPVPRIVRNVGGAAFFSYDDAAGQGRLVRLMTFLDGTPLDRLQSTAAEREAVGEALAGLRVAMRDFSHPHDEREIAWDVKHLLKLEYLIAKIPDFENRRKLEIGMRRFETIEADLKACPVQVLHNDFSKSNIVVRRDGPSFVTGIIDFGDVVRTAVAIDVSTAMLNQLPSSGRDDLFAECRDLLRGYLRVASLSEHELRLLPHLVMGRVIARALITTWRAAQFPDNQTYILRNTQQGWDQLDWFLDRSPNEISESFSSMFA